MTELITPELRALCLEAHDDILNLVAEKMTLRSDLDEARSENLKLRLCLSCVLPIAENSGSEAKTVDFIRSALGMPPLRRKPRLEVIINEDRHG